MILFTIYITGIIPAYRRMKRTWINEMGDYEPWIRVFVCFLAGFGLSWIGYFFAYIQDPKRTKLSDPPKWL